MLTGYECHKDKKQKRLVEETVDKQYLDMVKKFMAASEWEEKADRIETIMFECLKNKSSTLELSWLPIIDANLINSIIPFLQQNPQITEFTIEHCNVEDKGIIYLATNCALQKINCSENNIESEAIIALTKNPYLVSLDIHDTSFNIKSKNRIEALQALAGSQTLKKLIMWAEWNSKEDAAINDEGAQILASNRSITHLDVRGNNIGAKGAKAFSKNSALTYLDIGVNPIDDAGVSHLSFNKNLIYLGINRLGIERNQFLRNGLKYLASNHTLKALSICYNGLGNEGMKTLSNGLNNIEKLDVTFNNVSDQGALFLSKNNKLKELIIYCNDITDIGAKYLSENTSLIRLDITNNRITEEGRGVLSNSNIKELNAVEGVGKKWDLNLSDLYVDTLEKDNVIVNRNK